MSGSPVLQLRVPAEVLAEVDRVRGGEPRSAWVLALIERELADETPRAPSAGAGVALDGLQRGEACPGVVCIGPGCWQRSTARYGLRQAPLCPACAAALVGEVYSRPGADRARAAARLAG